ncbi:HNH endonuclease [Paenibacillus sp. FSL W7-1287]|uniref:HNH endonuclease n=1 Tax=Paenibacillus sp. FSL W7-1287 TaxID=2954538 RepID=UPI0030F4F2CB
MDKTEVVFKACISKVKNHALKQQLESCEQEIIKDSKNFIRYAKRNMLHLIPEKSVVGNGVSKTEMEKVYTDRMAKKSAPGRAFYDKLITTPKNGICPLCGHRIVQTLDHHLPKAKHPSLVVSPINLIPACSDCNKIKLDKQPTSPEEEPLHPYFDDVENDRWLYAEVIQGNPISLRYHVKAPSQWDAVKAARVKNHFASLGLARLYSIQAATELADIKHRLNKLYHSSGPDAVRSHLLDSAESCEQQHLNYWKTAMYHALAQDTWYHNSGVNQ